MTRGQTTIGRRHLGQLEVSAIGLGCLGMSGKYGPVDVAESIRTVRLAVDLGINLIDTADIYGVGGNEALVGRAIAGRRAAVVLATKFGITALPDGTRGVDARPERVFPSCEASLRRLGVDTIDLYYLHRVDPAVPIEESVGAMAELVRQGKVRYIGLSMASAETLRRASAVHPITALQSEWSLWARDIEVDVVPTARELDIGLVPYAPLGRGLLTGAVGGAGDLHATDVRRHSPRFQGVLHDRHAAIVSELKAIGAERGVTPAQLAIAWLLAMGDDVVPIPGTSRAPHLESNATAAGIELSAEECDRLATVVPRDLCSDVEFAVAGVPRGGDSPPAGGDRVPR